MYNDDDRRQIDAELQNAEAARARGAEGQARVCSRRAAGIAIRAYLESQNQPRPGMNAYDLIQYLRDLPGTSPEIQKVTEHLSARVNEQFNLPEPVDLIAETRWLVRRLEILSGNE